MKPPETVTEESLRRLAQWLSQRWRPQGSYRIEQVTEAAGVIGLASEELVYAHALFCSKSDFDAHYRSQPGQYDYENLRKSLVVRR